MKTYILILLIGLSLMCEAQPQMVLDKQFGITHFYSTSSIDSILFDSSRGEMNFFRTTGTTVVHRITDILQGSFKRTGEARKLCDSVQILNPLIRGIETSGTILELPYTDGNGGDYYAGTAFSTGGTGLKMSWTAGVLSRDTGSILLSLSGYARSATTYIFHMNFAGTSCAIRIPVIDTCLSSCGAPNIHNPNVSYGRVSDRDGNEYRTVQIGNQEWMAENLMVEHYRNGDPIPVVTDDSAWASLRLGASCWMLSDSSRFHCPYGLLYNAFALEDGRGICPAGWHIPSSAEWNVLENFLGGSALAGQELKSAALLWAGRSEGTNSTGWSALPGGVRVAGIGFLDPEQSGYWWTNTNSGGVQRTYRALDALNDQLLSGLANKTSGLSVRCVKD